MGCDIHVYIEMQAAGGVWTRAEDLVEGSKWDTEEYVYERWYNGRNYDDFALLADVRGQGPAIIPPRYSVPDDASESVHKALEMWEGNYHTAHWYTLAEIEPHYDRFGSGNWGSEVHQIINRMRQVANEELGGNPDKIRMVFFFDN